MTAKTPRLDLKSLDIKQEQINKLKELFPEAVAEGKVDFDKLKLTLGAAIDDSKERYGMTWAGKANCFRIIQEPSVGTLKPARDESVNFDTTENLFIEGDNLEVLKLLQKSYYEKVKMIYIDPPYNTGKDFVYKDKFGQQLDEYLKLTKQVDEEGKKLSTNTDSDGRYHSNWMNMMYPRLFLAKNLLREDGAIFISIDDNEVDNLRLVCDEIFGAENFVSCIIAQTNPRGRTLDKFIAKTHEYILVYAKNVEESGLGQIPKDVKAIAEYNKEDSVGKYRELELRNRNPVFTRQNRPNLFYPIYVSEKNLTVSLEKTDSHNVKVLPLNSQLEEGCWTWSKEKVQKNLKLLGGKLVGTGVWRIYRKDYLPEEGATTKAKSIWTESNINHENGKEEVRELFGKTVFDFPKSVELVKKCLQIGITADDTQIVLDFFAGSSTTAQAVMELSCDLGNPIRFIMVQLPERTPENSEARKAGYHTLSEVSKERVRKASKKIAKGRSQLKLEPSSTACDLGFKVFKLDRSNFKVWDSKTGDVQTALDQHVEQVKKDASPEDVLYELLLKDGIELTVPIKKIDVDGKTVYSIEDNLLLVCLEEKISQGFFKELKSLDPHRVIVLDKAFHDNDQLKTNAVQTLGKNDAEEFVLRTV